MHSRSNYPACTLQWLMLFLLALSSCTQAETDEKDKSLQETRIALAVQQTDLARQVIADPGGAPTLAPTGPQPVE